MFSQTNDYDADEHLRYLISGALHPEVLAPAPEDPPPPAYSPPAKDCIYWLRGHCREGESCSFQHDPAKQRTASNSTVTSASNSRRNSSCFASSAVLPPPFSPPADDGHDSTDSFASSSSSGSSRGAATVGSKVLAKYTASSHNYKAALVVRDEGVRGLRLCFDGHEGTVVVPQSRIRSRGKQGAQASDSKGKGRGAGGASKGKTHTCKGSVTEGLQSGCKGHCGTISWYYHDR